MKSGAKTTEFYLTLIPYILIGIKSVFGIEFEQGPIIDGILGLMAVVSTVSYIWSRTRIKETQIKTVGSLPCPPESTQSIPAVVPPVPPVV